MTHNTAVISHLDTAYTRPLRDPLWQDLSLSSEMLSIIDAPAFQQLNRIKQLGPSYLVYPGATHTRLSHSLGVFHLARRMIRGLALHRDCIRLSLDGVRSFLVAALLHDLGHFPFTHSFKDLPLQEHEALTAEMIRKNPLAKRIRETMKLDPQFIGAIVDDALPDQNNDELRFYRNLLSGALDPDKLDYLNRDAYFCGVPYGLQDIEYALRSIHPNGTHGIALHTRGVSAVENILFSKYLMYRAVYWHKTVRVATAMIKKAVHSALSAGAVEAEELYLLDDELFAARFAEHRFAPLRLIGKMYRRELHKTVLEVPFQPGNPKHARLSDLQQRAAVECEIARELGDRSAHPTSVIIDLPEPVSFEFSVPLTGGESDASCFEGGTVFTPQVVSDFTRTLRKLRFIVAPQLRPKVTDPAALFAPWL